MMPPPITTTSWVDISLMGGLSSSVKMEFCHSLETSPVGVKWQARRGGRNGGAHPGIVGGASAKNRSNFARLCPAPFASLESPLHNGRALLHDLGCRTAAQRQCRR